MKNKTTKLFEATIITFDGRTTKDRTMAIDAEAARLFFQQKYGPRAVPYMPKIVPG